MQYDQHHEDIIIDEEFQRLLPPLEENVYSQIEESMLKNGIRDPLTLWNGILIDGYNRYKISRTHNLPFNTISMEFPSRDEVTIWIIKNQNERRNLTQMQHRFYRGLHYNTEKRIITNAEGKNQFNEVDVHNEHQPKSEKTRESTSSKLSAQYNVSPMTIRRDGKVASALIAIGEISPEIKLDILAGRLYISNKHLHELASGTEEDIKELIKQIEDGTYVSRPPANSQDPDNELGDEIISVPDLTSGNSAMQSWEKQFIKMTDDFRHIFRNQSKPDDTASVKNALRQYINMLENLYNDI